MALQVVGIGLATLDVLIRLKDMPTWERGSRVKEFRFDGGGLVGTAMVACAKLGAMTGFMGTVGNDEAAEIKMRSMTGAGVDISHIVRRQSPDDQVVFVYVNSETGERLFSGVERWGSSSILVEELDKDYITSADYLHLDGFHYDACMQAAKWMQEADKTVVIDCSKTNGPIGERTRKLVENVDVLISGTGFAKGLTGISDIWEAGKAILDMGPRIFVETVGEEGSYTITADEQFHTPAFNVKVIDTTGAGDVFHGAYIVGMIHGWNIRQIAQFSTAVSAIKCTKLGGRAGIPCFDEVMSFLEEQGIHIL